MGLETIYDGFLELTSCRDVGMSEGPIPWTAMNTYCEVFDIHGEHKLDFFYLVRSLDNAYLNYQANKQEKKSNLAKKKPVRTKGKK